VKATTLPRWFAVAALTIGLLVPIGLAVGFVVLPGPTRGLLAGDGRNGSVIETLTILVLIPAILVGAWSLFTRPGRTATRAVRIWLALWTLAAFYFAGEEASWGQWFFHWRTPMALERVNKQHETNLHNVSTWFNQKPQAFAEMFIAVAGWMLPSWRLLVERRSGAARWNAPQWADWVLAPAPVIPSALFHTITKVCIWLPGFQRNTMGHPELQEFAVALFMVLYVIALVLRLPAYNAKAPAASTA